MYSRLVKNPLWCSIIVHGIYRMLHLTGAPLKVLSVSLVITGLNFQTGAPPPPKKKSVRQYSKCQNLLIDWDLEFLGGTSSDPQIVFKHVNFRGAPVKLNTLYVVLAGGKSIWSMVSPPLWRMFIGTVCLATRAVLTTMAP